FFTTKGRVYRAKAYELQEAGRDAKGQHVANLLALQPDEQIAQVLDIRDYGVAPYLALATRGGYIKKTALTEYDTNRTGGIIAINLNEGDEVVSALLVDESSDVLLVSRHGQSLRFTADDNSLRPMGRSTAGVHGMKFRDGDTLLSASVVARGSETEPSEDDAEDVVEGPFVFVVTEGGFAKRTAVSQYRVQGRNGFGILVAKLTEARGE
ncbi:DNA gyrase subunit A, partial [Schumannella luteola]